ncbi:MAG: amidohydrolase family protein [Proteobacteria bacterium]|nr:amidohydrolase family protein [Pseudomonadota bacterium]
MDLILCNARLAARDDALDIGVADGRIAALAPGLQADCRTIDLGGRLVVPGLIETHIHLDKTCILDRCTIREGTVQEAIAEVGRAKQAFTAEDIYARGRRMLERCIVQGTTRMRTHVEVDPGIGLLGFEAVQRLARDYAWAIDVEICVFPQEGLLNRPGTDALLVEGLKRGARTVGAVPYADTDPRGHIDRVFAIAQAFDVDIDMHLDLAETADGMQIEYVCDKTEEFRYGGRVAVGHATQLSVQPRARFDAIARRLADVGVAVTVLPATDLFLMGRRQEHSILRGVTPAHWLVEAGVNCSLSTNNVMNPFTPYGDGSLIRMANLYANVCHVATREGLAACLDMVTTRSARLMRLADYAIAPGNVADLTVLDAPDAPTAVAELAQALWGFKRGRPIFTRPPAELHRPSDQSTMRSS